MDYDKLWLSLDEQVERLRDRGLQVDDVDRALTLLRMTGYYRLKGYLFPFRRSEESTDETGKIKTHILSEYQDGTTLAHAEAVIDFDRELRLLVMEGVERIEIAIRMRIAYILGRRSPYAHEIPSHLMDSFTACCTDLREPSASKQMEWLKRTNERQKSSDERFVAHFREKYDNHLPIWALTEILELGQLSSLYRGMLQEDAEEIATTFGIPKKKLMSSWLATLNYVRNVSAHHARLFNRKLQNAPMRPPPGMIPDLDHLRSEQAPKADFGTYNALAIIAYLLKRIDQQQIWTEKVVSLFDAFPTSHALTIQSMGVPKNWRELDLWKITTGGVKDPSATVER